MGENGMTKSQRSSKRSISLNKKKRNLEFNLNLTVIHNLNQHRIYLEVTRMKNSISQFQNKNQKNYKARENMRNLLIQM